MDIIDSLKKTKEVIEELLLDKHQQFASHHIPSPLNEVKKAAAECILQLKRGNKIFFMGNGGSAAEAQHLAGELVSYFMQHSKPYAALAMLPSL